MTFPAQSSPLSSFFRTACLSAFVFTSLAGCKSSSPALDDGTMTKNLQAQLNGDSSIGGQPIQASVQNGVATLNGTVSNYAQKALAGRDAASIAGVKEVMNNLAVATPPPSTASVSSMPEPPVYAPPVPVKRSAALPRADTRSNYPDSGQAQRQQQARNEQQRNSNQQLPSNNQPNNNQQQNQATVQPTPPAPAQPLFRDVTVPAGTVLPVRVTQTLDSASTQEGAQFSGIVASDIMTDGIVAIPAGTNVTGHVDVVHPAAHFSGSSLLTVSLSSVNRRGDRLSISTEPYTVEGKGRGRNTAEKAGGGAAVGAILGGIFGGGKGAAIGAATGGGLGAGANAVTRGQEVQIPSETVVRFHLTGSLAMRVRTDRNADRQDRTDQTDRTDRPVNEPVLIPRNPPQ